MKLNYKDSGVDIDAGNELVKRIKSIANNTQREGVLGGIGGFGALFALPLERFKNPILVSSTDGVGTKLKLAIDFNQHDSIGIDLVAMCVNDIIVQGAEPLFFLDYFATSKLEISIAEQVIKGIAQGCQEANTALVGGETAEMPGLYQAEDYDLAGFVVGIVEKSKIINGDQVCAGDTLIALPSSGLHSNGFSLVRKILSLGKHNLHQSFDNSTLGKVLLTPTRIYVKTILKIIEKFPVKALAHITGGGLVENLPRVLPNFTRADIQLNSWEIPKIFQWLQAQGNLDKLELLRTFNCGIGMVICIPRDIEKQVIEELQILGECPFTIGSIQDADTESPYVRFLDGNT